MHLRKLVKLTAPKGNPKASGAVLAAAATRRGQVDPD